MYSIKNKKKLKILVFSNNSNDISNTGNIY